jgi:hypothetical protein
MAITAALLAGPLMLGIGYSLDLADLERKRQEVQNALDAALMAAAVAEARTSSKNDAQLLGQSLLAGNARLADADFDFTYIGVPSSPEAAEHGIASADAGRYRLATVEFSHEAAFGAFGDRRMTLIAGAVPVELGEYCVLALDPTRQRAISIDGSSTVRMPGCTIAANSNASPAIYLGNSAYVEAECLQSPGSIEVSGFRSDLSCETPRAGAPSVADPFQGLPVPEVGAPLSQNGCGQAIGQGGGAGGCEAGYSVGGVLNLTPGTYSGLDVKGRVHLEPGEYIMAGQLHINASANLTGEGVTFFMQPGAQVNINGNASIELSAPRAGTYSGFLFVTMPGFTNTLKLNGNSDVVMSGIVYAPTADTVEYTGNGKVDGECIRIVARTVTFTGNSTVASECPELELGQSASSQFRLAL